MTQGVIRVFPCRTSMTPTDEYAFVGDPPLFRPEAEQVHVSVAFTWDIPRAETLAAAWGQYYSDVRLGGPALGTACNGFESGLYVREGVTFTSRGCNGNCPWCLVPANEGRLKPLRDIAEGYIIQDNNFLQCPPAHRQRVYAMLSQQSRTAIFSGGLQASLVTNEVAAELHSVKIGSLFLAADTEGALGPLERAVGRLPWLPREKLRCYVLIGFNGETVEQAERRLKAVWEIGCLPFAQLYQPASGRIAWDSEWRHLNRTWSRPAAMKAEMAR